MKRKLHVFFPKYSFHQNSLICQAPASNPFQAVNLWNDSHQAIPRVSGIGHEYTEAASTICVCGGYSTFNEPASMSNHISKSFNDQTTSGRAELLVNLSLQ